MIGGESVSRSERREVWIVSALPTLTVTWSRYAAGEQGPGLHVHREHTDAFYVLDGTVRFRVGPDGKPIDVGAGGFVAVPPGIAHAFANESDAEANWLNFHAPDCGFASYLRDGTPWDSFDVPEDGGGDPAGVIVR